VARQAGNRFGEIAVREGFASRTAVRECLEIQSKLKSFGVEPKRIGEIMVEKGFLRDEDVQAILEVQSMGGSRMESRSGNISEYGRQRLKTSRSVAKGLKTAPVIPGYEVVELLGEGGMGVVYKARQKSLDRMVALKILPTRAAKEKAFIERFIREARTVARLNHENIIAGIDVGEADGTYYFAMEYVEGESVADMVERLGALEERTALQITAQMARALAHAHKHGLVHRDVKPQNILVTRNNMAKLCDLGLAKSKVGQEDEQGGVPIGTPHYLSPEQARGEADVDIRSDIYSLGATLYHMLTGSTPFDGQSPMVLMTKHLTEEPQSPRRRDPRISKAASDLVMLMMEKEKEDRQQTPSELLEDVERVLQGKRSTAGSQRTSGRRGSRRKSGARPPMRDSRRGSREDAPAAPRTSAPRRGGRGRAVVRARKSGGDSATLVVGGLVALVLAGFAVFVFLQPPSFPGHNGTVVTEDMQKQADEDLRRYRAIQQQDPTSARSGYQEILRNYPNTHAAQLAKSYLDEMDG
jgi:serine/threonine-protein kinase